MTIPKKVVIGGVPYAVKHKAIEREDTVGHISYRNQAIELSKDMQNESLHKVLVHEVVHGLFFESGMDELIEKINDEAYVTVMTNILYQFLKDNDLSWINSASGQKIARLEKEVQKQKEKVAAVKEAHEKTKKDLKASDESIDVLLAEESKLQSELKKAQDMVAKLEEIERTSFIAEPERGASKAFHVGDKTPQPIVVSDIWDGPSQKPRHKKISLRDSDKGIATIGDMYPELAQYSKKEDDDGKPEHWKTGIKEKDGIKCYRTRYHCQCGHKGNQYERDYNLFTKCHKCSTKLVMKPATSEGFPARDMFGNFFIAEEVLEESR